MASKSNKIELYEDKAGEWRWRMTDPEGAVIGAACEGYKNKSDCEKNAKRGKNAKDKWEFYEDKAGAWRWRRMASNGEIVGAASHGFTSQKEAESNAAHQGYTA